MCGLSYPQNTQIYMSIELKGFHSDKIECFINFILSCIKFR